MSKISDSAVKAVRKKLSAYTQPRWHQIGDHNPATIELLSGAEFIGGSALVDMETVLRPLLAPDSKHRLPKGLGRAIRAALAKPRISTLRSLEAECLHIVEQAEAGHPPVLGETLFLIRDLMERMAVYGAALGCPEASKRCAVLCTRYWPSRGISSFVDVITYGLMRSTIDYLAMADTICTDDGESYLPESRHMQVGMHETPIRGLVHVLGVVQEAIAAGEIGSVDALNEEMAAIEAAAVAEDRAGIVRRPAEKAPPRPDPVDGGLDLDGWLPTGPGLRVVGDVSHVKKGSKGDDPVKEAEGVIGKHLPLVMPPADLAAVRAELLAECPHGVRIVDRLLRPLAMQDTTRLPHVLLWGPPGGGKTRLARRIGEVLDLQPAVYSMAGSMDAMAIMGVSRGWSTGGFSAPMREFIRTKIANPMIVVDEVDKMGTSRHNGNAGDALINLLGVETSARYRDIYLTADVDASRVQWILTANTLDTVPRALIDRCLVLRVDEPGAEHLRVLATSILEDVKAERGLDDVWAPPFDGVEWAALEENWSQGGSLRALRRLIEVVLDARDGGLRQ
ncbi:Lon protease [Methylobacterium cerastii]|uniref:Lon protease n=1 Tax=Methylobacterium cerastii TaxID=932741 RepID=A0ABQ4QKR6_9HYPH|nr:AAA family ATPase [Methylobacterium cerastii]GJD45843.1 Lon protease [Methylobacterium cerastii]